MAFDWQFFVDNLTHPLKLLNDARHRVISVETFTPQRGPWSGNNNLGFSLDFNVRNGSRASVLTLPEWGMPDVWTIALGIDTTNLNWLLNAGIEIAAVITAGVGGSTQDVTVNWQNGTILSMPMNALTVTAVAEHAPAVSSGTVRLTATISRGTRPGASYPIRTILEPTVAAGTDSNVITIPDFARRVDFITLTNTSDLYNPASYIEFYARLPAATPIGRVPTVTLLQQPDGISIPGYARSVFLHNGSGVGFAGSWNFKIAA